MRNLFVLVVPELPLVGMQVLSVLAALLPIVPPGLPVLLQLLAVGLARLLIPGEGSAILCDRLSVLLQDRPIRRNTGLVPRLLVCLELLPVLSPLLARLAEGLHILMDGLVVLPESLPILANVLPVLLESLAAPVQGLPVLLDVLLVLHHLRRCWGLGWLIA